MNKMIILLGALLCLNSVWAQEISAGAGVRAEHRTETDSTTQHAVYGEVQMNFRYADEIEKEGFNILLRTNSRAALGLGTNGSQVARYGDVQAYFLSGASLVKKDQFRIFFGLDPQVDIHGASSTAPYQSRFRPIAAGFVGAGYYGKKMDLLILPEAGWNLNSWMPVVGGRASVDTESFFTDIQTQYEFAKNYNSRNSDIFMVQLNTGVKLVCASGKRQSSTQKVKGLCVQAYGEVEHWNYNRVRPTCNVCQGDLINSKETTYGVGIRVRF